MTREPGFYWVKVYGEWEVAEWHLEGEVWNFTGEEGADHPVTEIDERRITRDA